MKNFKAGTYVNRGHYRSFEPALIHRKWILDDPGTIRLLSEADQHVGRLDMFSGYIPNIDLFISMHVAKEATQSSKIEGTQTNIEDAMLDRANISPDKRNDWEEVQNYIEAMNTAIKQLELLPFSTRLIRKTHKVLMQGVRGAQKQPGEFRRSQNWIGGVSINDAVYIPPVHEHIPDLMGDLEKFMHDDDLPLPELIKIAIMHYQFETIHPFLDGNGRVGRLMITLYMVSSGILRKPVLYLSDFFEKNRADYYEKLGSVRTKNDLSGWIRFFLRGVIQTANNSIETFDRILKLQKEIEVRLLTIGARAGNANKLINHLYRRPFVTADQAANVVQVSLPTAYSLLSTLEEKNILHEVTGADRNRLYAFQDYLNLFRS